MLASLSPERTSQRIFPKQFCPFHLAQSKMSPFCKDNPIAQLNILLVKITAQKCKLYNNALYVSGHVTVQIWLNYSTVLLTIQ